MIEDNRPLKEIFVRDLGFAKAKANTCSLLLLSIFGNDILVMQCLYVQQDKEPEKEQNFFYVSDVKSSPISFKLPATENGILLYLYAITLCHFENLKSLATALKSDCLISGRIFPRCNAKQK